MKTEHCRVCGEKTEASWIEYASLPVAGCYVQPETSSTAPDPCRPFALDRCTACGLVQLREPLDPAFYADYRFVGDIAAGYRAHLDAVAHWLGQTLEPGAQVIEVGASNGSLLEAVAAEGLKTAGYEPSIKLAAEARERGHDVRPEPLGPDTAVAMEGQADAIVIRHVMEHIDDLNAFMEGVGTLAHEETVLLVEVPDLASTVRAGLHTNFYHPHVSYFDRMSLAELLNRWGWWIDGSTVVDIFGGSLLVCAVRAGAPPIAGPSLPGEAWMPISEEALMAFAADWSSKAARLRLFLEEKAADGYVVDGYGAAERTVAAMGFAALTGTHIRRLYDRNQLLWGWSVPGSRIPIAAPDAMLESTADLMVIFASSHEAEIMAEQAAFEAAGGRFVSLRGDSPRIIEPTPMTRVA